MVAYDSALKLMPKPKPVTYTEWLEGRCPEHLSTNAGTHQAPFQGWRNFKEAYAPELIGQAFEETSVQLGRPVKSCIDPFGGSGTTALACQFLGVRPTTIEVNPYLADLIEAKLSRYDLEELIADFKTVTEAPRLRAADPFPGAPSTFVEPGVKERFLFPLDVAQRLASLRHHISKVKNPINQRLMRVMLGAVALPVSNVVVSGKGRRYKPNWMARLASPDQVDELFIDSVVRAIYEIRRFQDRKIKTFNLVRGDSRENYPSRRRFDMAVFSPPYPNSFDYTDVYNVELWVCEYLTNAEGNRNLRSSTLRSHVQVARSYKTQDLESATLTKVAEDLADVRSSLWNKNIPDMVGAYFGDMATILSKLSKSVNEGGRIYMVVGDSQYAGVQVPVAKVLCEIAQNMGLELAAEEPFRSMRASPQQGGRLELLETLITLNKN